MPKRRTHGEGGIYKQPYRRKDGREVIRWIAEFELPPGIDGKRRRWRRSFATREDARKALQAELAKLAQGLPIVSEKQTVAQFLTSWLEEHVVLRRRARTVRGYRTNIVRHLIPHLGQISLTELGPQHVQAMIAEMAKQGLSPRTIQYAHGVLRAALNQAVRWGLVTRNVATLVTLPRQVRRQAVFLTEDQARAFLDAIRGHRYEALFTVSFLGLRPSEVLGLRWEDIDQEHGVLYSRYTLERIDGRWVLSEHKSDRSRRSLPLPAFVATALARQRELQITDRLRAGPRWENTLGLVFTTRFGRPLDERNVSHTFQRLRAKIADFPALRWYDLRHTCATILLARGLSAREIMEILGHSQVQLTLNTYAHVLPSRLEEAARQLDDALGSDVCPQDVPKEMKKPAR